MANKTIPELNPGGTLTDGDLVEISRGGASFHASYSAGGGSTYQGQGTNAEILAFTGVSEGDHAYSTTHSAVVFYVDSAWRTIAGAPIV